MHNTTKIDYSKSSRAQNNWKCFESMRCTLLQLAFLNQHLDQALQNQQNNIRRHCQDRLIQLSNMYDRSLQLQVSNVTRYLIVRLEELIDLETPLAKIWPKLDKFLDHINDMKNIVKNSSTRVYLGKNVAIDISKLSEVLKYTQKQLLLIIERHGQYFEQVKKDMQLVNQIFGLMQLHCREMNAIIDQVECNFDEYMMQMVREKQSQQDKDIQDLRNLILN